jgi:hypothetical protein
VNRLGVIDEDGLMIEEGFDLHTWEHSTGGVTSVARGQIDIGERSGQDPGMSFPLAP